MKRATEPADIAAVTRTPFWLDGADGSLAAWLHQPPGEGTPHHVAVICNPLGYEYTHAHRSLRRLADTLAARGLTALRFDYHGTGNSPGDSWEPELAERWVRDVRSAIDFARSELTARTVTLVGLRVGGLLAAAASVGAEVDGMVLWSPVARGRRYVREWEALARVGGGGDSGLIEAGGHVLSRSTADALAKMDLAAMDLSPDLRILWAKRDDLPEADVEAVLAGRVASVDELTTQGFSSMMDEPQFAMIPAGTIERIAEWVGGVGDGTGSAVGTPDTRAPAASIPALSRRAHVDARAGYREEFVTIPGAASLFGVLSAPAEGPDDRLPLLVLANSGSVHQVGPNRLYVEIARGLAEAGIPTLRIDLRNLGESLADPGPDENHPYAATAVEDALSAVRWGAEELGARHVVLGGLCSGAYVAYRAAQTHAHPYLAECLLINPLTFEWQEGMTLEIPAPAEVSARDAQHYRSAFRNPERWKKALRGEVDFRYFFSFVLRRITRKAGDLAAGLLETAWARAPSRLSQELTQIKDRGRRMTFVFSFSDPGLELLRSGSRRTVRTLEKSSALQILTIGNADHTFSRREWRVEVFERVRDNFLATYSPRGVTDD